MIECRDQFQKITGSLCIHNCTLHVQIGVEEIVQVNNIVFCSQLPVVVKNLVKI